MRRTRQATAQPQRYEGRSDWTPRPWLGRFLRALIFVTPMVLALTVTSLLGRAVYDAGWPIAGRIGWFAAMLVTATLVANAVGRVTNAFLPLAALCHVNIEFPEAAPSRLKASLRIGNTSNRERVLEEFQSNGLAADPQTAAEQVLSLVEALNRHDRRTRGHSERVRALADVIGEEMGLSADDRNRLRWAAMLHDIGKLAVPAEILNKQGRPDPDEWELIKGHPAAGEWRLAPLEPWLGEWIRCAWEHHERVDGTGYPKGLTGADMPLASKIVAVADAFEVMTAARSYKQPMTYENARAELVRCSGTHFDATVVRAFLRVGKQRTRVATGLVSSWVSQLSAGNSPIGAIARTLSEGTGGAGAVIAEGVGAKLGTLAVSTLHGAAAVAIAVSPISPAGLPGGRNDQPVAPTELALQDPPTSVAGPAPTTILAVNADRMPVRYDDPIVIPATTLVEPTAPIASGDDGLGDGNAGDPSGAAPDATVPLADPIVAEPPATSVPVDPDGATPDPTVMPVVPRGPSTSTSSTSPRPSAGGGSSTTLANGTTRPTATTRPSTSTTRARATTTVRPTTTTRPAPNTAPPAGSTPPSGGADGSTTTTSMSATTAPTTTTASTAPTSTGPTTTPTTSTEPTTTSTSTTPTTAPTSTTEPTTTPATTSTSTTTAPTTAPTTTAPTTTTTVPTCSGWQARYYNSTDLSGPVALEQCEPTISNRWLSASPGPGVNPDFSARYSARINFGAGGSTRFDVVADDGIRVTVDGTVVISDYASGPIRSLQGTITLTPGEHDVVVEFFDDGDWAVLRVGMRPAPLKGAPSNDQPPSLGTIDTWAEPGDNSGSDRKNHGRSSMRNLAVHPDGSMYFPDSFANQIWKIGTDDALSLVAGTGTSGFAGDGGPATAARLSFPQGVAYSPLDNSLYIGDRNNQRIRKVDLATGIISTVAGTGIPGNTGDGGLATAARLHHPSEIAVDGIGRVIVLDHSNGSVRRISTDGVIDTVIGGGSDQFSGADCDDWDLKNPEEIAVDPADGTIYVGEDGGDRITAYLPDSHRCYIVVGTGTSHDPGVFGEASEVSKPNGIAVLANGDLLFTDESSDTLQLWQKSTGQVWVVAGQWGSAGTSGDGGPAAAAKLDRPEDIVVRGTEVFILEQNTKRIRRISP